MNTYLVGLRCSKFPKCNCASYQVQEAKDLMKKEWNCIYDDACYYVLIVARSIKEITLDLIKRQVPTAQEFVSFYVAATIYKV